MPMSIPMGSYENSYGFLNTVWGPRAGIIFKSQERRREPKNVPKSPAEVSEDPCGARENCFERLRESGIEKSVSEASETSGTQRTSDQVRAQNYLSGTACD